MAHIGQKLAIGGVSAFRRPKAILEIGGVLFELKCPAARPRIGQTQRREDRAES